MATCFSMETNFILKPMQLFVHGLWMDILIKSRPRVFTSQKTKGDLSAFAILDKWIFQCCVTNLGVG